MGKIITITLQVYGDTFESEFALAELRKMFTDPPLCKMDEPNTYRVFQTKEYDSINAIFDKIEEISDQYAGVLINADAFVKEGSIADGYAEGADEHFAISFFGGTEANKQ